MDVLFYFINSAFTDNEHKKATHPSMVLHFIQPLLVECVVIIGFVYRYWCYCGYFAILTLPIAAILLLDIVKLFRNCLCIDLQKLIIYDCYFEPRLSAFDLAYFVEMEAYNRYEKWGNDQCSICYNYYSDENYEIKTTYKQLLYCGHLYHRKCLQDYQLYQWENNIWRAGFGKCSLCKTNYQVGVQTFDYNSNYEIPHFTREPNYYFKMHSQMLWNPMKLAYHTNKKQLRTYWQQKHQVVHPNCVVQWMFD
eukprot:460618_1